MPCVAEVVNRSLKADCTDFTRDLFMTRTGVHSGLEKYRFHQTEEPRSPDLRDLSFCMRIHKREVLVEVHQTCWLQRLLFFK